MEAEAGTPAAMDTLRRRAGRPDLPVWFVFFKSQSAAIRTANYIKDYEHANMFVSYSAKGEYGSHTQM